MKEYDPAVYQEYILEKFAKPEIQEQKEIENLVKTSPPSVNLLQDVLSKYPKVKDLDREHECYQYVLSRKIPEQFYDKLYYTDCFCELTKQIDPELRIKDAGSRLVIPFYDENKKPFALQGRTLPSNKDTLKYLTIKDKSFNLPKIYGLDRVDLKETVYVVEGPIDSMFLKNSLAVAGSDLNKKFPKNFVAVFDNEPRNIEIVKKYQRAIYNDTSICIWPSDLEYKDINDMVLAGLDPEKILRENTVSGLSAQLKFKNWKKI